MSRCSCESNTKAACEGGFLLLIFAEHFYCMFLLSIFTAWYCAFLMRVFAAHFTSYYYCAFLLRIPAEHFYCIFSCVFFCILLLRLYYILFFVLCYLFLYLIRISGIVPVAHPDVSLPGIAGGFSGNCRGLFRELPVVYSGNCRGFSGNCRGLIPGTTRGLFPESGFY